MSLESSLERQQFDFFRTLGESGATSGFRGRFEIYRYAYFERIRASIEEDFPLLFEYLDSISEFPGGIDAEAVTRDLLVRNHPASWTLSEASLPVRVTIEAMLSEARWVNERTEALRLASLDEAEALASWLEEWPEPEMVKSDRVAAFAEGKLLLARSKTWRESGDRIFWRSDQGVLTAGRAEFLDFIELLEIVEAPIGLAELSERTVSSPSPAEITRFLRRGVSEGWLRLTPSA